MAASPAQLNERAGMVAPRPEVRQTMRRKGPHSHFLVRLARMPRAFGPWGFAMKKALLAMMCAAAGAASAQTDKVVVLEGARLIDGTGKAPLENGAIVVQGDRITAVGAVGKVKYPKGARVVDVRGRTIMPGLINAHGHVGLVVDGKNRADGYTRENILAQLAQYEQYGVTSI